MPSLTLTYLNSKAKLNDILYLGVSVDTAGQLIAGLDVQLDVSSYLQIIEYQPTTLLPIANYSQVFGSLLVFGQETAVDGSNFMGLGQIATIKCKAIKKGTANIKFISTLGNTIDSNLASPLGQDILTSVKNAQIKVI